MSLIKPSYELSIWDNYLNTQEQKEEHKGAILSTHDMSWQGKATNIVFTTYLNGTHSLSFQICSRYFDDMEGDYVDNELIDQIYDEVKIKLFYKKQWYEFVVKEVTEDKYVNQYIKNVTCKDSFIEELSRNGYDITFDAELNNNVEELGVLSREILDGSAWNYAPEFNWGDFTEYIEDKCFRVPVSSFKNNYVPGAQINFQLVSDKKIKNYYSGKIRDLEMGDDLASSVNGEGGYFWNQRDGEDVVNKIDEQKCVNGVPNDGYIYIPCSQFQFCYVSEGGLDATLEPQFFKSTGSYAICPKSTNPNDLIQFIAIPKNAPVEVDETGLLVNKDYHFTMTIEQWNNSINSSYFYKFKSEKKEYKLIENELSLEDKIQGNYAIGYLGYLEKIGDLDITNCKKISISDRTELNVTKEIDQYVKVYNTPYSKLKDFNFEAHDYDWNDPKDYKDAIICSKTETRMITPELARNLCQNGVGIKNTIGWEIKTSEYLSESEKISMKLSYFAPEDKIYENIIAKQVSSKDYSLVKSVEDLGALIIDASDEKIASLPNSENLRTVINFGPSSLNETLESNQIYCFGLTVEKYEKNNDSSTTFSKTYDKVFNSKVSLSDLIIKIGEGNVISDGNYSIINSVDLSLSGQNEGYILFKTNKQIKNPYISITIPQKTIIGIKKCELFKAFTKGRDFFDDGYFMYSGRDLAETADIKLNTTYSKTFIQNKILLDTDIMAGESYEYNRYFIQRGKIKSTGTILNTLGKKELFGTNTDTAIFDESLYDETECEIQTLYFDMNSCPKYNANAKAGEKNCSYTGGSFCLYQKYGYCPYYFETEKHCRKIRTINSSKSNRFNLTQEVGKIFELYPNYVIEHENNGAVKTDKDNLPIKRMFYIKEKGVDNSIGFRYGINLDSIQRQIQSNEIVTKLYVEDVDSEVVPGGICSIKLAEDNIAKDSFIFNFDYYIAKGLIDKQMITADLYGVNDQDLGYLQTLGHLNGEYDKYTNKIINLTNDSLTKNEANLEVNLNGIIAANKELGKINQQMSSYESLTIKSSKTTYSIAAKVNASTALSTTIKSTFNTTLLNYYNKYNELKGTINSLIKDTFITEKIDGEGKTQYYYDTNQDPAQDLSTALNYIIKNKIDTGLYSTLDRFKESDEYKLYKHQYGLLGQYNEQRKKINEWKKRCAVLLKQIKKLSQSFFKKYEDYLKEGTWTDDNYLTNNAYYCGALNVSKDSSIPKVEYTINCINLSEQPTYEDYIFNVADTTYVEDALLFGINSKGNPNKLKVLISEISNHLDEPVLDTIKLQNFTTQFEDLFQQITATVQSVTLNENIYKRASNFSANKVISNQSIQGALDTNDLTLLSTQDNNIILDKTGTQGEDINNHSCKYKITGEGIYFSTNGGETWDVGVGPSGINADYIKAGTLDAGKVRIVDNDYVYFLWDKGGIYAYQEPTTENSNNEQNNYALFNRFGLSLAENGKIRLRTGYSFNGEDGFLTTEKEQGTKLGFYLYNNNGVPIFSTYISNSEDSGNGDDSARLSLSGEIFTRDQVNVTPNYKNKYKYSGTNIMLRQVPIYDISQDVEPNTQAGFNGNAFNGDFDKFADTYVALFNLDTSSDTPPTKWQKRYYVRKTNDLSQQQYRLLSNKNMELYPSGTGYFDNGSNYIKMFVYRVKLKYKYYDYSSNESVNLVNIINQLPAGDWENREVEFTIYTNFPVVLNDSSSSLYVPDYDIKGEGDVYSHIDDNKLPTTHLRIYREAQLKDRVLFKQQTVKTESILDSNLTAEKFYYYTELYSSSTKRWYLSRQRTSEAYYLDEKGNIAYQKKEEAQVDEDEISQDGYTELYINNSDIGNSQNNQDSRLFCCVRRSSEDTYNIFTIKKSGQLFIGGTIPSDNDKTKLLPTNFDIENYGIQISGKTLMMDFNNFKNIDGEDILSLVSRKIASSSVGYHSHTISTISLKYDDDTDCVFLPSSTTYKEWIKITQMSSDFKAQLRALIYKMVGLGSGGTGKSTTKGSDVKIPDFKNSVTFNAEGTVTDGAGSSTSGTSAVVYVDPVQ